jgi:sialate O-acetylesterase
MMLPWFARVLLFPALLFFTTLSAFAEVRLPKLWSDHAVLQRDRPIHVWGWGEVGERVTVTLHATTLGAKPKADDAASATADSLGHWSLYLQPHAAGGGPYTLAVSGTSTITLNDLLIGDLWVASGQSNMEMPLSGFQGSAVLKNGAEEIRGANHPEIRMLHEPKRPSMYPLQDQEASWTICTPETAADFSAVAYFFAREIQQDQKVPIGLVEADWGGTPAEAWTSLDTLGSDAALMPLFAARAVDMDKQADAEAIKAQYAREDAEAKAQGRIPQSHPWQPPVDSWAAASLYNGMIAPVTPLAIRGVIWYQGESNSVLDRAPLYHRLFSSMIEDWRRQFAQGDFPFLYTQISSYRASPREDWGTLRDAQRRTLSVAHTAMAVTLDVGDPENVHPADKQTVGHRLALAARQMVYGEDLRSSGPLFRQATTEASNMRVWFTGADGRLAAKGGALQGFELAGADHRFLPATARIADDGKTVVVGSEQVKEPRYVRYAWANAPEATLMDDAGLPASTFTSELVPTPPTR